MKTSPEKKPVSYNYLNKVFELAKDYFMTSEDRYTAWLLLIGSVITVIAFVALLTIMSWWSVGFWAALTSASLPLFMESMQSFALIVGALVGVSVLKNYLVETLSIRWRNWLTDKLVNKYLSSSDNNYLDLARLEAQLDNPGQRIQSDVKNFVDQTLSLSTNFIYSVLTQISFIGTLWVVGGALSFVLLGASITIPGYLVWAALLFSAVASLITHRIGRSLVGLNRQQESLEADFRKGMDSLSIDSEPIAQDKGEPFFRQLLSGKMKDISQNAVKILGVQTNLMTFTNLYQQIGYIFPFIVAAPLCFIGQTGVGQLMLIGDAFSKIQSALDWFINSYELLAEYKTSLSRIIELENALEGDSLVSTKKAIVVEQQKDTKTLVVSNLNIAYPSTSSTGLMMSQLSVAFKSGESTLIQGESGLGKSTLFKVMAGTWKYGDGNVVVADYRKMCFLPQKPALPKTTLKAVLAYPADVETYTKDQYIAVLTEVGKMDAFIAELDTVAPWSTRLSGGEQQRISVARALLKKPDWLFLDEATCNLDSEGEEHVYNLIRNRLKDTTFISIAHHPAVAKFHQRIINFIKKEGRIVEVQEETSSVPVLRAA